MNAMFGPWVTPTRIGFAAGMVACCILAGTSPTGLAQDVPTAPKLVFLSLASADGDKAAVEAWQKAIDDSKNAEKLAAAAKEGKAPVLLEGAEGKYTFIAVSDSDLASIGINLSSKGKKDVEIQKAIAKGQSEKKAVVVPDKKVLLYSRKSPEKTEYFLLARPTSDTIKLGGAQVEKATIGSDVKTGASGVLLKLTKEGTDQFKKFTTENQKHYLVLLLNDKVIYAAKIPAPITTDEIEMMTVAGDNPYEIAAAISRSIPKKPKPVDLGKAADFTGKTFDVKPTDEQAFLLTCEAGKEITATTKAEKDSDVNLYIYDADDKLVGKDDSPGPKCEVKFKPAKPGVYKLVVTNKGGDNKVTLDVKVKSAD